MLQGPDPRHHAQCVATQERIVRYYRDLLNFYLPECSPNIDFDLYAQYVQAACDRAFEETANAQATIQFLLTENCSSAGVMQRFETLTSVETPNAPLARQAMAILGIAEGDMSRPELRSMNGARGLPWQEVASRADATMAESEIRPTLVHRSGNRRL
jgi:hypothetical protein